MCSSRPGWKGQVRLPLVPRTVSHGTVTTPARFRPGSFGAVTHVLLTYTLADDYLERRAEFRAEHLGLAESAVARGELVLAGAVADPYDKSLFVWREDAAAAAEAFVKADPYVANGLVLAWEIRTWNTMVGTAMA